jgi:hypothetical protein
MREATSDLRDAFWAHPPALPSGLKLERREPLVVTRQGPGGTAVYDLLDLAAPQLRAALLAAYQVRLLAGHVQKLKAQLLDLAAQRRVRSVAESTADASELLPAIITDVARPSVIEACQREGVALLDQRGTCVIRAPSIVVYVEGKGVVERPSRVRLFGGKASRIVRLLLTKVAAEPTLVPRTAQAFATACALSYVYAHGVLTALEKRGFVDRKSSHGGFRLRDPVGLLRTWIDSEERTAVATEGFYAPATTREALLAGIRKLKQRTDSPLLFTLASALEPDELHVAALPHGVYWNGELQALVEAFGLKRTTPHNFLVLRPDPLVWTEAGGILLPDPSRSEPTLEYRRVALPQVAADFAALAGRGKEQAEFLLGAYAKGLPYRLEET